MLLKCYIIEISIYEEADEVIQELFELLLLKYQTGLAELMKLSNFIFDCVNLKRFGSYINSPGWIKTKMQQ